jgi:hypothetical protein
MRRSWLAVLLLLGACTGPVRSTNVYESKAGSAAQDSDAYGRYLTQVLAEASEDADAAQGTFDGIQPPDHRADRLSDQLDELLGQATDTLTELRTLARRGRFAELVTAAAPLAGVTGKLHAFAEAHA